jgi:hypothetical protein
MLVAPFRRKFLTRFLTRGAGRPERFRSVFHVRNAVGVGLWDAIRFWDTARQRRTDVRVRMHRAHLLNTPGQPECYFLNVWNASPEREVTVTHTWFATEPLRHFLNAQRPLPARIAARDQWETWIPVAEVAAEPPEVYTLGRVQLADNTVVSSVERTNVPGAGAVPG